MCFRLPIPKSPLKMNRKFRRNIQNVVTAAFIQSSLSTLLSSINYLLTAKESNQGIQKQIEIVTVESLDEVFVSFFYL